MAQRLATGRIIWAEIADANGIRKLRPAVIVTPTDQIASAKPFDAIAITSRLTDPLPEDHVVLPWHPRGHPRTGLNRRCAAVCGWLAQLMESDIHDVAGSVPGPIMATILAKIAAASAAPPAPTSAGASAPPAPPTAPLNAANEPPALPPTDH